MRGLLYRLSGLASLVGGVFVGAAVLGVVLLALERGFERVPEDGLRIAGIVVLVVLGGADVWATAKGRLYPLGPRRQAQQRLMFRGYGRRTVAFVWGFDAGLGATTYRVTSGVWLLAILVALGLTPAWVALVYAAGFGFGLLAVVLLPVRRVDGESASDAALRRVLGLGRRRQLVQLTYVLLAPVAVASAFLV